MKNISKEATFYNDRYAVAGESATANERLRPLSPCARPRAAPCSFLALCGIAGFPLARPRAAPLTYHVDTRALRLARPARRLAAYVRCPCAARRGHAPRRFAQAARRARCRQSPRRLNRARGATAASIHRARPCSIHARGNSASASGRHAREAACCARKAQHESSSGKLPARVMSAVAAIDGWIDQGRAPAPRTRRLHALDPRRRETPRALRASHARGVHYRSPTIHEK